MDSDYITIDQAGQVLNLSRATINRMISNGWLTRVLFGRKAQITKASIEAAKRAAADGVDVVRTTAPKQANRPARKAAKR